MFDFCPHCGQSIGQDQQPDQAIVCRDCGQTIGVVAKPEPVVVVHQADELIRQGVAARCPQCGQLVEVKVKGGVRSLAPHFAGPDRKLCSTGGKPLAQSEPSPRPTPAGKDLDAYMIRESIRVVSCRRGTLPRIEELTLAYLDKSDRVPIQIEALRDILGADFRMGDYPSALGKPHLAVWGSRTACVVGKQHERGGYQAMSDAEVAAVVEDLRGNPDAFFQTTG